MSIHSLSSSGVLNILFSSFFPPPFCFSSWEILAVLIVIVNFSFSSSWLLDPTRPGQLRCYTTCLQLSCSQSLPKQEKEGKLLLSLNAVRNDYSRHVSKELIGFDDLLQPPAEKIRKVSLSCNWWGLNVLALWVLQKGVLCALFWGIYLLLHVAGRLILSAGSGSSYRTKSSVEKAGGSLSLWRGERYFYGDLCWDQSVPWKTQKFKFRWICSKMWSACEACVPLTLLAAKDWFSQQQIITCALDLVCIWGKLLELNEMGEKGSLQNA